MEPSVTDKNNVKRFSQKFMRLAFLSVILLFSFIAAVSCSSQSPRVSPNNNSLEVYKNASSEISKRPWATKGLDEVIAKETLTVIKNKDGKGEAIILRWHENGSEFKADVYRRTEAGEPSSWTLANNGGKEKTLTYQHGDLYMITELIEGKNGGQKTQIFKLIR